MLWATNWLNGVDRSAAAADAAAYAARVATYAGLSNFVDQLQNVIEWALTNFKE